MPPSPPPRHSGSGLRAVLVVTVTTVIGGGLLALPIALAPFGVLRAVILVVAAGLISTATLTGLAAAYARSSAALTSTDRLPTLVRHRFGRQLATLSVAVTAAYLLLVIAAYGIGIGGTLASTFGGSATVWAVCYLAIAGTLIALRLRGVLVFVGTTVTVLNFILIVVLMGLLAREVDVERLTAEPLADWHDAWAVAPVFGTLICVYAGFAGLAGLVAPAMRADPSGRSLVRGVMWAMLASTVIYAAWVTVTLGSAPADAYLAHGAAGIDVIASVTGPIGEAVGTMFVGVAMGMAGLTICFAMSDMVLERLPTRRHFDVDLAPGTVVEAADERLSVDQLVVTIARRRSDGILLARARAGSTTASEPITGRDWESSGLLAQLGLTNSDLWIRLTAASGSPGADELWHLESTMSVRLRHTADTALAGLITADSLDGRIFAELTREPKRTNDLMDLAERLGLSSQEVHDACARLLAAGRIIQGDDGRWHAQLGIRRHSHEPEARRLSESYEAPDSRNRQVVAAPAITSAWWSSPITARVASVTPVLLSMAMIAWLIEADVSFTTTVSMVGIVGALFLGSIVPMLLAIASRRNRDIAGPPGVHLPPPWVMWTLIAVLMGTCLVYAIAIYQEPVLRLGSVAGLLVAGLAGWWSWRHGGYRPAAVLVLQLDDEGRVMARCIDGGVEVPVVAPLRLPPPGGTLPVTLPAGVQHDLRIIARHGDVPPAALGDMRVSWPGGHAFHEPPVQISGIKIPRATGAGPVQVSWEVQ